MKGGRFVLSAMVLVLVLSAVAYVWASTPEVPRMAGVPVPMLINYQGVLTDPATGKPVADGSYAVTFSLYDVPSGGIALWSETQTVTVEKGLFNVLLGNVNPLSLGHFTGTTYLGIKVETDPEMTPRHQVVSVAYALYAREAVNADTLDGEHASAFADATHNHDDRYWSLTGNAGTVSGEFLGTTDSMALELGVNGARALRLEPNATSPNLIGGHSDNDVTAGVVGATIGGGGASGDHNSVTDDHGTVGGGGNNRAGNANADLDDAAYAAVAGGENNIASGRASAIGGGSRNTASGRSAAIGGGRNNIASAQESTIGGGERNTASGYIATVGGGYSNEASGNYTAISGGFNNTASGVHAAIGGGHVNTASGPEATVPGGGGNLAQGAFSLAAGRDAQALHDGAFVWADSIGAPFASFRTNQFRARANGGVRFDVNNNRWVNIYDDGYRLISTQTGAYLSTGGVWTNASDREQKENFTPVNAQAVLARLAGVPITTWNYKAQEPTIRHMGPMAQDFYAAFGLGEDDRHISTVDANGVALAAIQGLHQLMQEKDAQIASLQAKVQSQQAELDDLKARVERLEQRAASGSAFPLKGLFPFLAGAGTLIALAVSGSFHIRARK